ncbi:MAG: polysaccharide pyruvyl transferase family protein [Tissierellia bacterium]|nr:polysaccharide pyruvyl transferase family protein [Tissierellia bacterium]
MKKIYFKGYYGYKNIGDDVFCVTADWICNNIWENVQAVFIGKDLPKLSNNAKVYSFNNGTIKRIFELINLIRMDKIIYFGGSLLHSRIRGLFDIKYYLNKYRFLYNKLGTIGTSVGPFKSQVDRDSIREFLKKFRFICVRDYSSLKILEEMGITEKASFCFDPAILINDVFPSLKVKKRKKDDKIKLGISLCHYERYVGGDLRKEREREAAIESFLDEIIESNDHISEITFFIFHGSKSVGDEKITKYFYNKYKDKIKARIVDYTPNTEQFCQELNSCDIIFGVRLHSGILAYALEIPFILVEYHKKCTEFLSTINYNNRFYIYNHRHNVDLFNNMVSTIINDEVVHGTEEMIKPEYFKKIIKDQLVKIEI